jgi:acyl-CoA thioester hydrolase
MARQKIEIPPVTLYTTILPITINYINYGNHVGNDSFLTLIQEARLRFLASLGVTELQFFGDQGTIVTENHIQYLKQLIHGDFVQVTVHPQSHYKYGFSLVYHLQQCTADGQIMHSSAIAEVHTLCFNYNTQKPASLPALAIQNLFGETLA